MQQDVLIKAEALDGYRKACAASQPNRAARLKDAYELGSISKDALYFLRDAAKKLPLLNESELAILDSTADSGLPHTRPPNIICMPAAMCKEQPASEQLRVTLLHEGMHVHQRLHSEEWIAGCRRAGWTPLPTDAIPKEFRERARINPDTMAIPFWAWDTHHAPVAIFKSAWSPSLTDAPTQWLDLRMATLFHGAPPSIVKRYGDAGADAEHPYELYADIFSRRLMKTGDEVIQNLKTI